MLVWIHLTGCVLFKIRQNVIYLKHNSCERTLKYSERNDALAKDVDEFQNRIPVASAWHLQHQGCGFVSQGMH